MPSALKKKPKAKKPKPSPKEPATVETETPQVASAAVPPVHQWTHDGTRVLLVKCTGRDGTSHDGFVWPKAGPVSPKNWSREPTCESGGLFGWPWGLFIGDGRDPDACAPWIVFSAKPENVISLEGGKCKAVPGKDGELPEVIYYGDQGGAMYRTSQGRIAWVLANSDGEHLATGTRGSASATGYSGSASATGTRGSASATGYSGSASATGYSGSASATGYSGSASATGYSGSASATGYSGSASATGYSGSASATGYSGSASATGYSGSASATGTHGIAAAWGADGTAMAGEFGIIQVAYWDEAANRRRIVVGYVGEDGIEANTPYRAEGGKLVKV